MQEFREMRGDGETRWHGVGTNSQTDGQRKTTTQIPIRRCNQIQHKRVNMTYKRLTFISKHSIILV